MHCSCNNISLHPTRASSARSDPCAEQQHMAPVQVMRREVLVMKPENLCLLGVTTKTADFLCTACNTVLHIELKQSCALASFAKYQRRQRLKARRLSGMESIPSSFSQFLRTPAPRERSFDTDLGQDENDAVPEAQWADNDSDFDLMFSNTSAIIVGSFEESIFGSYSSAHPFSVN